MAYNYDPLWRTMETRGVTKYALQEKHKISPNTISKFKNNQSVTVYTLNRICKILHCKVEDVVEIDPDK